MSRIGRMPVPVPAGVDVQVREASDGSTVTVKGPRGELTRTFHRAVTFAREDGAVVVQLKETERQDAPALHGLSRALLYNMVTGVATGYRKSLELQGAGYRAQQAEKGITLLVGYSHPVRIEAPDGIQIQVEANTRVHVEGADKELVGQTAAHIRAVRPPEVYTGKGIRYAGEQVRRKAGKATGRRK